MSRKLLDKARRRLASEKGGTIHPWGGRFSVALIYPNRYSHAMSNLGFLTVHHLLNQREDTLCERFFLPDPEDIVEHQKTGYPLFSLESGRPLADFDLIAVSLSFENDALHLPLIFELGRIPLWAKERESDDPLLLCGGVCAFLNPEPFAEIFDLFAVGEAEVLLHPLLAVLLDKENVTRRQLLQRLAIVPGLYVPTLYEVVYNPDNTIAAITPQPPAPARVERQWLADLDSSECRSFIISEEAEFSGMALTEISRGCSRGCRFCAAGFIFLPPRERSLEQLTEQIECGLSQHRKQGLVGAAVSDYSDFSGLTEVIHQREGTLSPASLRIDAIDAATALALATSGHRTATLAPEAGSQRMRDLINKGIDEAQILAATRHLAAAGILNLKLYFLIGLPTEGEEDIAAILELTTQIRTIWVEEGKKRGRLGSITLSVNPFVPKPFTPLQWAAMCEEKRLESRIRTLRSAIARTPNCELNVESPRAALLQGFLSRGDRRVGAAIPLLAAGKNLRATCRELDLDPAFYLSRERGEDEIFPWEVIDCGVSRRHLWNEYQRAIAGLLSPRCAAGCSRCGICGQKN
ncbi:MAG: radical SAM protein [Desulfuromonadales bacterium]|nr:radical SAM protein [Desulfuromonadales bacterium]